VFGNNLELRIKKHKKIHLTRIEPQTSRMLDEYLTICANTASSNNCCFSGSCNIELRRVIFLRKKIKLGVKMMEFSDGVLDLDAHRHKAGFIR
jgi:heptaprenylglyceryl phosphate synthase